MQFGKSQLGRAISFEGLQGSEKSNEWTPSIKRLQGIDKSRSRALSYFSAKASTFFNCFSVTSGLRTRWYQSRKVLKEVMISSFSRLREAMIGRTTLIRRRKSSAERKEVFFGSKSTYLLTPGNLSTSSNAFSNWVTLCGSSSLR